MTNTIFSRKLINAENFDNYLPSQDYNFELVKNAMDRNAIIIIARDKIFSLRKCI